MKKQKFQFPSLESSIEQIKTLLPALADAYRITGVNISSDFDSGTILLSVGLKLRSAEPVSKKRKR